MEQLEVETGQFTAQTFESAQSPAKLPVVAWSSQLCLTGNVVSGLVVSKFHGQPIFSEDLHPLTGCHSSHVQCRCIMYLLDRLEEAWRVVGEEAKGQAENCLLTHDTGTGWNAGGCV